MESILTSVKKLLGITEDYTQFDTDIVIHINTVLSVLHDLGVGPAEGFSITDKSTLWSDYIPDATAANIESVKTYTYLKVRLIFDPPASTAAQQSMKELINELEFRILLNVESKNKEAK